MKRLLLFVGALVTTCSFAQTVIFSEDFSNLGGVMPAGWTVIDNDGLTPNANVSQFTSAWIVAADFDNTVDTVAMSTSWYTPAGTSDDWLVTPAINLTTNNTISWEAEAQDASYPDGYELRISTTTPTIAGFNANPALFTIANENGAVWTQRSVDLQAAGYSNQTVYFAWRNNSTDQFILMIDDVSVTEASTYDAIMDPPAASEYTIVPLSQIQALGASGSITNNGSSPITNVTMTVNVYDGSMSNVYNATSTPQASLGAGASSAFSVAGYTPSVADVYTVEFIAGMTEADAVPANNTVSYTITVSDSVYARDDGNVTGSLGIGAGNGGQLGQAFTLNNADDITSVSIFITNANGVMVGQPLSGGVYATDVSGTPTTLIVSTTTMTMDTTTNTLWTLPISGGSYNLAAGDYVVVVNEVDSNVTVGTANSIFTAGKTWVTWPTNPLGGWSNNEDFSFNVSYVIRPNFADNCVPTTSTTTVSECASYTWTDGNTYTTSGTYTQVLTNAAGCDSTATLNLTIGSLDNTTTQAGATITANQAGATYQWIDCGNGNTAITGETNQSYTATVNGDYAVIITSGTCSDTSACVTINNIGLSENLLANGVEVFPNPSNGNFSVQVAGLSGETLHVALTDASGKVVSTKVVNEANGDVTVTFQENALQEGIYFVKVSTETKQLTERLVITRK